MKRQPLSTAPAPRYPPRRAYLTRFHRAIRKSATVFGVAVTLIAATAGAESEGPEQPVRRTSSEHDEHTGNYRQNDDPELEWMFWLEEMGFCPTMDCDPEPQQIRTAGVRLAGATVAGSLSRESIRRYIRLQRNQYRRCYEEQLFTSPGLAGRVTVRFVIGSDGIVSSATVAESTLGSSHVESCVVDVIRQIHFPRPEWGGTFIVTYPFTFRPTAIQSNATRVGRSPC